MSGADNAREIELSKSLESVESRIASAVRDADRRREDVTLICVTKTYPTSDVAILQRLGMHDFAENRESEGARKALELNGQDPSLARWHYQGKIQSNKIKSLVSWASVIHSLDEIRHVPLIARALPPGKQMEIFIQVSLDSQPGRGGTLSSNLPALAEAVAAEDSLRLMGLMAVGPLDEDPESAFSRLARIHSDFKEQFPLAPFLSAGMSADFEVAISHGATHIRVGSSILGSRALQR